MTARLLIVLVALVLAAPAAAGQAPEELWREYPLEPTPTTSDAPSTTTPAPRFTPPVAEREIPPSAAVGTALTENGDSGLRTMWLAVLRTMWLAVIALCAGAIAVIAVRRRLEAMPARAAVDAWTSQSRSEAHSGALRRFAEAADAARALAPAPVECVVRREGVVRSRFVAEVEPQAGRHTPIASSRSFWRRGTGTDDREGEARRAWDDLIDGLQADGWELAPAWGAQEGESRREEIAPDEVRLIRTRRLAADTADRRGTPEPLAP